MMPLFAVEINWPEVIHELGLFASIVLSGIAAIYAAKAHSKGKETATEIKTVSVDVKSVATDVQRVEKATNGLVEEARVGAQATGEIKGRADERADRAADKS